jgi:integrase
MSRRVRTTIIVTDTDGTATEVPRADVWVIPSSTVGYIIDRNGTATARLGHRWKSLHMPFIPANRVRAIRAAEAWIREQRGRASSPREERPTWSRAWLDFKAARLTPDGSESERRTHARVKRVVMLFLGTAPDGSVTEDSAYTLTTAGMARLESTYHPGTVRFYIGAWSAFLAYCRARGWLATNPLEITRRPEPPPKRGKARVYDDAEMIALDRWCVRHGGERAESLRLLGRFLLVTGCRIHEALALEWSRFHAGPNGDADGYIDFVVTKGDRPRAFPIAPFPELARIIARLRRRGEPRPFPWRDPESKEFLRLRRRMFAETKIDGGPRPIHVFRATAERRWRRRHISPEIRARLAGHSVEVMMSHYDAEWVAAELAAMLDRNDAANGNGNGQTS